jgi:hypothetical protein
VPKLQFFCKKILIQILFFFSSIFAFPPPLFRTYLIFLGFVFFTFLHGIHTAKFDQSIDTDNDFDAHMPSRCESCLLVARELDGQNRRLPPKIVSDKKIKIEIFKPLKFTFSVQ